MNKSNWFWKISVIAPNHITVNYLDFALISMETKFIDNFQYKDNYAVPLRPDCVLWES